VTGDWRSNDCVPGGPRLVTRQEPRVAVSVVIATKDRPALLERCLAALSRQTLPPHSYEVLVVDDGPHDTTEAVVRRWSLRPSHAHWRYLRTGLAHGPAAARNAGWRLACGTIVAFTDDDCIPDAGWLEAGLRRFDDPQIDGLWGRIVVPLPMPPTDWERNVAGLERAPCATANCFYRRSVLLKTGGFDERFTEAWREDSDLQFSVLRAGGRVVPDEQALVVHPVRPAPWGISIRLQRQNRFNALLFKKYPDFYRRHNPHEPPVAYYTASASLLCGGLALAQGQVALATLGASIFCWHSLAFCLRRLRGTSRHPKHVAEMLVTSLIIPPYAVFWRLYGAVKYRVAFF